MKKEIKHRRREGHCSLYITTKSIWSLLQQQGPLPMKVLAAQTCKRRCYDVIAVLEAVGKIERVEGGKIKIVEPMFNDEEIDSMIFKCHV